MFSVPTPGPADMNMSQERSPQAPMHEAVSSSVYPATTTYGMTEAPTMQHRVPHVNYVPQAGNAPLMNDYTAMPCNLQV